MSAPQGPRTRSSSRGRGNARAAIRSRATARGGREKLPVKRATPNATTDRQSSHHLKPPPNQNLHHNKSWRNPSALSSAFQSHAGRLSSPSGESWRNPAVEDSRTYKQRMSDIYQTLKQNREQERKDAIKDGFLADPDKPTSLAYAITPVGTCQDMCPEYERVERIVQLMVDGSEKISLSSDSEVMVPSEEIMVKRFRRSAAGYDEQLPSDIRPPAVLQKTLDYLINDVIGGPEPLHKVHKFVWDRTRGIRNDFSIQQVTKVDDLRVAIDCFERIARFHILSLHQLSKSTDTGFDHHQEREQLNNTLLSLMYYYDDSRHKLNSPNEAEFRAYCIIFEIQDQRPDLEDRAQNLPRPILIDSRVQIALKLYAAAGNTSDEQGPLRPRSRFVSAQANTGGFWNLVQSNAVSYMMACVAEIYFGLVRRIALKAMSKAYRAKRLGQGRMEDWSLKDLTNALGFDDENKTQQYFRLNNVAIHTKDDGTEFVDVGSVMDDIDDDAWESHKFSIRLVESKRLGRTLPAVINGLSAAQAQSQGFIEVPSDADTASVGNSESLFVGESDDESTSSESRSGSPQKIRDVNGKASQFNPAATTFAPTSATSTAPNNPNPFSAATTFGKPSSMQMQTNSTPVFDFNSKHTNQAAHSPFESKEPPKFNFFPPANTTKAEESRETRGVFDSKETPKPTSFLRQSTPQTEENSSSFMLSPFAPLMEKKAVFGQPSTTVSATPMPEPTKAVAESNPARVAVPLKPFSVFDQPAASSGPPVFSFETSPLFGPAVTEPKAHESRGNPFPTLEETSPKISAPQQKDAAIEPTTSTTPSDTVTTPLSLFPSPSNPLTEGTTPPPAAPLRVPASNDRILPTQETQSSFASQPSSIFPSSIAPTPQLPLSSPSTKLSEATQKPPLSSEPVTSRSQALSGSASSKPSVSQASQEQSTSTLSQLDPRSIALNELSRIMLLEDNGIIQHFIEFTVGPIIKASIAQFDDESSWKEARECRAVLLAKKFFKRWKVNAWNMSLMRKAKQRRRNFAMSIQKSVQSERQKRNDLTSSLSSLSSSMGGQNRSVSRQGNPGNMMPPPLTPLQKRQSLPSDFDKDQSQLENSTGAKRKREDSGSSVDQGTPRHTKIYHKRSRTVGGDSIMSAPPHPIIRTPYKTRMDVSKVKDGSLLSDILMRQARRLAPNARSDTTHTDYFQLKARGIDPDTPIVPLTKKRTRIEMETEGAESSMGTVQLNPRSTQSTRLSASQPATQTQSSAPKASGSADDDDDEELFAQIRSVREALAESEQWCRSERESMEKSMTPQTHSSPPNNETPAQRRLREIRERGKTPSRTELRLRAMGDKALLPKGFWDGEGMGLSLVGKGKQKEVATPLQPSKQREQVGSAPRGFAALEQRGQTNGFTNGPLPHVSNQKQQAAEVQKQTGSSADDAIEL